MPSRTLALKIVVDTAVVINEVAQRLRFDPDPEIQDELMGLWRAGIIIDFPWDTDRHGNQLWLHPDGTRTSSASTTAAA